MANSTTTRVSQLAGELRINLFGPVHAQIGERTVVLGGSKTRALFAYLAFEPKTRRSRQDLASLLWPDATEDRARQSLRSSLYQLRRGIDEAASASLSDRIVTATADYVVFDGGLAARCDVIDFGSAVAAVESHTHDSTSQCAECIAQLNSAADLYQGEFLTGITAADSVAYDDWLLLQRESLRNKALHVLHRLVQISVEVGDHGTAHDRAFQILQLHRYDEHAHRAIMSSLAALGHIDQSLGHYQECQRLIHEELGVELEAETTELAATLEREANEAATEVAAGTEPEAPVDLEGSATNRSAFAGPLPDEHASAPNLAPSSYLPFHRNRMFVGRVNELDAILRALTVDDNNRGAPAAAALTGIGGIGKTQLAVAYAYAHGHRYPGGVQWIDFSDPDNIAGEVAWLGTEDGLGLFGAGDGLPLQDQVAQVTQYWRSGQPQLLIFDNCEDAELARAWLPTHGPAHILFTTRRGDWPAEFPVLAIPVDSLDREASVQYLVDVSGRISPDDADQVAAELGDHPLALHLAARFLARQRSMEVSDYVELLRQPSEGLGGPALRATTGYSPTAHDLSIERTFARSYEQLETTDPLATIARLLLARIVCLAPGTSLNRMFLLETVADRHNAADLLGADNALQRLVDLGLVTQDSERRVVMHRLTVNFISEVLDDTLIHDGRTAIERSICRDLGGERFAAPNERFESAVERSHLFHICHMALERSSPHAATLALALGRKLRHEWESQKSIEILMAGLTVAESRGDLHDQGRLLVELMKSHASHGVYELTELADRARQAFEAADPTDDLWIGVANDRLATGYWYVGDGDQAYATALRAEELIRRCDRPVLHARSLRLLAAIEAEVRFDYDTAINRLDQACDLVDPVADASALAATLTYRARVRVRQGMYRQALEDYRRAADAESGPFSSPLQRPLHLMFIASTSLELGEPETARDILTEQIEGAIGASPRLRCMYFTLLARTQAHTGDVAHAVESLHQAAILDGETEDPAATAEIWRVVGVTSARNDEPTRFPTGRSEPVPADVAFARGIACYDQAGVFHDEKANLLLDWARYERDRGNIDIAKSKAQQAVDLFTSMRAPAHLEHHLELLQSLQL